jgi:hypothetical protein
MDAFRRPWSRRAVVVGSEQSVYDEACYVHVERVDGGQALRETRAEVEVHAVRLIGQFAEPYIPRSPSIRRGIHSRGDWSVAPAPVAADVSDEASKKFPNGVLLTAQHLALTVRKPPYAGNS